MNKNTRELISACEKGDLETVKFLVTGDFEPGPGDFEPGPGDFEPGNKADVTAENNWAIETASKYEKLEIIPFLLKNGADFNKLTPKHKKYFLSLKVFRRWRIKIFLRKLKQIALPLYYSPGFPGYSRGRFSLEEFVGGI